MDDIKIDDIDKIAAANPFKHLWKHKNSVFVHVNLMFFLVLLSGFVFFTIYIGLYHKENLILAIILLISMLFSGYAKLYIDIQKGIVEEFMKYFADINGLSYRSHGSKKEINSPGLCSIKKIENIKAVVEGVMRGAALKMFICHYETDFSSRDFTACEIRYKTVLPRIFLSAKIRNPLKIKVNNLFDKKTENIIRLEGDFNKYFALYAPKELEIEILQIFTPEVMAQLIDYSKMFDLEFFGDSLYIYSHKLIRTGKELRQLFDLAELLANKLAPRLERIKFVDRMH